MSKLTKRQIIFLNKHGIPLDKTLDASGYSTSEYKSLMKDQDLWIAYGVNPCSAAGHKLRLRSGHCFECSPEKFVYQVRYADDQYVYLAYSTKQKLIKIGVTKNLAQREETLNKTMYGDVWDWKIISSAFVYGAGAAEFEIHNALSRFSIESATYKEGRFIATRELFKCSKKTALQHFKRVVSR